MAGIRFEFTEDERQLIVEALALKADQATSQIEEDEAEALRKLVANR